MRWVLVVAVLVVLAGASGAVRADEPVFDHWLYLSHLVFQPVPPALAQPEPDDGGTWTAMYIMSLTDGWLGTSNGSIYRLVNEKPQRAARLSTARINDISVAADGSVWAVTEAGEVLQGNDAGWRVQARLAPPLSGVSAVSASDVWAIRGGGPWHWDGAAWGEVPGWIELPTTQLVAASASNVWAASGNKLWRRDGAAWVVFKDFGGMRIDDMVAWAGGQVWVVGSDPRYPSDDPRMAPGAHLLQVWDGVQWETVVLSRGYVTYSTPSMANRIPGASCVVVTYRPDAHAVQCLPPMQHYVTIDKQFVGWPPTPLALFMVTRYDGWALTAVLYRIHFPAP